MIGGFENDKNVNKNVNKKSTITSFYLKNTRHLNKKPL